MRLVADPSGRAWICGCSFAGIAGSNPPARAWISIVRVACRQVEVSATSWSLIQSIPTECGVTECDLEVSIMRRSWPSMGCRAMGKGLVTLLLTQFHKIHIYFDNTNTSLRIWLQSTIRGCYSVAALHSGVEGYGAVFLDGHFPMFQRAVVPSFSRIIRNVGNHSPNDVTPLKTRTLIQFQFTTHLVQFWQCPCCIVRFCLKCFRWSQQFRHVSSRIELLAFDSHSQQR